MKIVFLIFAAIFLSLSCAYAQKLSIDKKKFLNWTYYKGEDKVHRKKFNSILRSSPKARRIMRRRDINFIATSLAFTGSMVYTFRVIGRGLHGLDTKQAETIRNLCLVAGILSLATVPKLSKAVKVYNNNFNQTSYLKLGITNHGVGLSYAF